MNLEDFIGSYCPCRYTEDFIGSYCPCCYTKNVYDSTLDFRFCDECGEIWADGASDPDFDDEHMEDFDPDYDEQTQELHEGKGKLTED